MILGMVYGVAMNQALVMIVQWFHPDAGVQNHLTQLTLILPKQFGNKGGFRKHT